MWTNTSVCTPISVSQRVGGVTESWTVLTSPMKSFVPLWYLALFLLRIAVLLDITSVQMISASRPYCVVMASQTALMERMSTAAVSICVCLRQVGFLNGTSNHVVLGKEKTPLNNYQH